MSRYAHHVRRPLVTIVIGCQHGAEILRRLDTVATQESIDQLTAALNGFRTDLGTALDGIQGDLDALKAANPAVDTTALEASVASLAGVVQRAADIDAENPAPVVVEDPAPVDEPTA